MTSPHNFLLSYRNFLSVAGQLGAADNRKLAVFWSFALFKHRVSYFLIDLTGGL